MHIHTRAASAAQPGGPVQLLDVLVPVSLSFACVGYCHAPASMALSQPPSFYTFFPNICRASTCGAKASSPKHLPLSPPPSFALLTPLLWPSVHILVLTRPYSTLAGPRLQRCPASPSLAFDFRAFFLSLPLSEPLSAFPCLAFVSRHSCDQSKHAQKTLAAWLSPEWYATSSPFSQPCLGETD